jgi:hypothetical protein
MMWLVEVKDKEEFAREMMQFVTADGPWDM